MEDASGYVCLPCTMGVYPNVEPAKKPKERLIRSRVFTWKVNMGEELKEEILSILPINVEKVPLFTTTDKSCHYWDRDAA